MAQCILAYSYDTERNESGMTVLAGLPPYLELAHVRGMCESIDKNVRSREGKQGYTDRQMVMSLVLLNLSGGDCVDDLRILESDEGFKRVMLRVENHGIPRKVRRGLERPWRKEQKRCLPSASSVFRYLEAFEDRGQSSLRKARKALFQCRMSIYVALRESKSRLNLICSEVQPIGDSHTRYRCNANRSK